MGERDRPDLTAGRRYVPLTRPQERAGALLRAAPVALLAGCGLALRWPWLVGVAVAWGTGVIVVARLTERSLNARLKALTGTLARSGDPHVAVRGLEALVGDARSYPAFHSVALLFLGVARGRAGDVDGALDVLHAVEHVGWLERRAVWEAWLLPTLARLHAERGEIDEAERWLAEARRRLPEHRHGALAEAEALVAVRRGQAPAATERGVTPVRM